MKTKLFTQDGNAKGEIELPEEVFGADINEHLMHLVVKNYLANQRQGTAKAKGRSDVSGGGKKPWRQKGTGRARAGSNTSPLWVRGGKTFGPSPRRYTASIPQKMRKSALRSALSSRAKDERIFVVDKIELERPKTKVVAELLKAMAVNGRTLLVTGQDAKSLYLSARNVKNVAVRPLKDVNAYDVLSNENIIFGAENLIEEAKEVVSL
ncbi:MAG: 50S ribosomal protein L4 [Chitinivibrionales bacterium]|nr:50S ribosomal protein L4 [Chitinivibrionales bacterium]MBD3356228.1 50S ribosomal protein L4 [Chitinivibrionales bacterium]